MKFYILKLLENYRCKILFIIVLHVFFVHVTSAQQIVIDSLSKKIIKLEQASNFSELDTIYINTLIIYGNKFRHINKDTVLSVAKKTLALSKKLKYDNGIVGSYQLYGHFYAQRSKNSKAISYYNKALEIYEKSSNKDKIQKLNLLNNKAQEYEYLGKYSESLSNLLQGVDLATRNNYKHDISLLNQNIAYLYISQKYYDKGLEYYENSILIDEELGDELITAENFSSIADIYFKVNRLNDAMLSVDKSIPVLRKYQSLKWLAYSYDVKGKIYLKQEKFNTALEWFFKSMLLHNKIDDGTAKIDVINGIAQAYLLLKKDSLAIENALNAYSTSKNINYIKGEITSTNILYKLYQLNNNFEQALWYRDLNIKLSDSLYRNANKNGLELLKVNLDYENEKALFLQENEKALEKKSLVIYIILTLLIILGCILFVVKRNKNKYKRLNKVLKQNREELTEINNTKNKLFSIVGHDLRGPIGSLKSLLNLYSEEMLSKSELHDLIPKIENNVDSIYFTLNNLLDWGNSQMNGSYTKPTNISITSLINSAMKLLSEIIDNKTIEVINTISKEVVVWADYNQIEIVLRNLLSNAIKFTPENGKIIFEAFEEEDFYKISITDTGVGMKQEIQEKIFSKNSNTSTYGTNDEKGTGLGLSLCKEMIENNLGTIGVKSTVGAGSVFYFSLPKK
jgi:signal transduction histidine kinase